MADRESQATVCSASIADISKLIDALRFYADPETYHATTILFDRPCGEFADDIRTDHDHEDYDRAMPGSLARTVLRDVGVSW